MPTREVHAVCTHDCPDSCGVLVTIDELTGRAVKLQGDPHHPVTRGFLCGKVARYLERVYSPDRLLYPMRRRPGVPKGPLEHGREAEAFERISWDAALDEIVARLKRIAEEFGPESILPYSYAGTIGQLGYGSMDRRFFYRLGASQLDRTICSTAGGAALMSIYGVRLGTVPQDFARAGLIIVWGGNVHGNNIHLWPFIEEARRSGARLIVIDPFRTRTAALADEWLPIRPGTDGLLAAAVMHVLFRDGLEDREYLEACTTGWRELCEFALLPQHAPERVADITGLSTDAIERLARGYGEAGREGRAPAAIRLNYGVQRSESGGTAVRAVAMLPLITGSWKLRGGGLALSTSGAFPFNTARLQMPELMLASPLGRPARTINMIQLGAALDPGAGYRTEGAGEGPGSGIQGTEDGVGPEPPVKALFVYNSNPAVVAPDSNKVLRGLRREDLFTVVHEQFFTDTTDYADIVLPATTFLEHKELMGAYGHTVAQLSDQAIAPLGEARPNFWLFAELGRRMGFEEAAFQDGPDALIAQALSGGHPWFKGITPEALAERKQIPLALPVNERGETLPFSDASWFRTQSRKAELLPVPEWRAPMESRAYGKAADREDTAMKAAPGSAASVCMGGSDPTLCNRAAKDGPAAVDGPAAADGLPEVDGLRDVGGASGVRFPLEFLPRKADNYMNSTFANLPGHQTMERRTAGVLEMHATDAASRGIATGDAVHIWNGRGRIELVARVAGSVPAGVVAARLDWHKLSPEGANVNTLTSQRMTDMGGGPTFYSTLVEVARVHPMAAD